MGVVILYVGRGQNRQVLQHGDDYMAGRDTVSKLHIYICISGGLGGLPWGCKGFLYGFGLDCVHLPGSCTAKLYGQVSCDYTCSQSQRMVLNDSGKVTFDERCISTTKPLHSLLQLSGICQEYVLNAFIT